MLLSLLLLAGCSGGSPERFVIAVEEQPGALFSVSGTAADDVWFAGGDPGEGPFVLHYDGRAFKEMDTGTSGDLWWVHAFPEGPVFIGGENGVIVRYDGSSFERMTTPGTAVVFGLWGPSPTDVWAVGGNYGGAGGAFVWRYDGDAWSALALPAEAADKTLFKVWGTGPDDVWIVGSEGVILHGDGSGVAVVPSPTDRVLFTVHCTEARCAAVGGFGIATVIEREPGGDWHDATPPATQQTIGVWVTGDGGVTSGINGSFLQRGATGWEPLETDLALGEAFHGVWVDPDGGMWAAGGQVLVPPFVDGIILYRGRHAPNNRVIPD